MFRRSIASFTVSGLENVHYIYNGKTKKSKQACTCLLDWIHEGCIEVSNKKITYKKRKAVEYKTRKEKKPVNCDYEST